MYKLYLNNFQGQDAHAWEDNWRDSDIRSALVYAAYNNPYKVDLDRCCLPGKRVLEGGCGLGRFVIYYAKKGCNIIGIDFARATIEYLKSKIEGLPVECASVDNIPYDDNSFDVYISIGVLEHFEEGPDKVLQEAHRVLEPGGYLILTVPYINLCKKIKYRLDVLDNKISKKTNGLLKFDENCNYKKVSVSGFIKEEEASFHQYEFTKEEVKEFILKNKFEIVYMHGCSVIYGLSYIPFIGNIFFRLRKLFSNRTRHGNIGVGIEPGQMSFESIEIEPYERGKVIYEMIKDILIRENINNLLLNAIIKFLQYFCGDFLLVVCRSSL